ncbi:MAG: Gfo/Idh/MocA family oxidoreductase [Tessaracoccus sp.]|uniref:Gfo/Idh/MocA family protein n=1 Tax=Tessaracoccus sp. TaxID=1971211 RepID=UPI001ECE0B17|nr:Gfo/Idh/MocA family oxidoreductase [Tessaracoccus sp.]MBK7822742.1 Gfo/Idh/MocA family oxidoreductase [Tessaracoccus sp.]
MRIGLLSFAHVHAAGYAALLRDTPGVELLCADPDGATAPPGEVRGRAFADALGVSSVETYDELFAWRPHAVVICSENARHHDLVLRAAAEGAHVLCEKPLATTVADGEEMVAACRAADVFLMTAYPVRFSPQFAALRTLIDGGGLGRPLLATGTNNGQIPVGSRAWFTDPELSGGGALMDHVVHVADLLDALLGGEQASSVRAVANAILHADKPQVRAETGGLVSVSYPSGLRATIDCSWSQPDHAEVWGGLTLEVVGTEAGASIDPFAQHVGGFSEAVPGGVWIGYGRDLDRRMLDAFIEGVRSGAGPQPDGDVGLRTLRIVAAAQQSAATGEVVQL